MSTGGALLERERELGILDDLLAAGRAGRGTVAVVEAPAGQGKTALIRAARARAKAAGTRVLAATGAELERSFAYGVVRQLFEPVLHPDPRAGRDLLCGAAARAAPIFDAAAPAGAAADVTHARLHGLFWLCANLAEQGPVLIVVDDAHWADAPSLRFLDVLARRIEDLPVVLVAGARPAEPGAEQALLDGLMAGPSAEVLRPGPLGARAIAELARDALGRAPDPGFVAATADSTAGNALFVREVLRAAAEGGLAGTADDIPALRRTVPDTLSRMVAARLRRLPAGALAVARAVAVLGERSAVTTVSALAGLDRDAAVVASETLVRAGLLEPDRLTFVHPIVGEAVHAGLTGLDAADWHREAARLLSAGGGRDSEVAAHLLRADPDGSEWAARALAGAGRRALADGAPDEARGMLRRALAEPPPASERAAVLLALGQAEVRVGDAAALAHLDAAIATGDAAVAGRAAQLKAYFMIGRDDAVRAAEVLRAALARPGLPPELRDELSDRYVEALNYSDADFPEYLRRVEDGVARERPAAYAHQAWFEAVGGSPVSQVLATARRALDDGSVLRAVGEEQYSAYYAIAALLVGEAAEESAAAIEAARAAIGAAGSPYVFATLAFMRPHWERMFGDLRRAEDELREALALLQGAGAQASGYVVAVNLAATLLDRGDTEEADRLLAALPREESGVGMVGLHAVRARLAEAHEDWPAVLSELEREYAAERFRGHVLASREASRVTEVRALLALGRREQALAVAEAEVELHRRRGAPGAEALARLSRALVLGGEAAVDELRAAAVRATASPMPHLQAQVHGALGAALHREGHAAQAREPLRTALDLASRCGARGLERALLEQLAAAGGRPRRARGTGADALTPAERRVADLAARGLTNRQIAETLFVTLKTVEVHLGHTYAKLDIKRRDELAAVLPTAAPELSGAAGG